MEATSLGLGLSFTAGLLSFLSPCVLPLVPSYVTFITGLSLEDVQRARRAALVHAVLFILGFTVIFVALGASATLLGRLLNYQRVWISRAGGVLIVVFGLYMLGVFNISFFAREKRVHLADKPVGYLGTLLVGVMALALIVSQTPWFKDWLRRYIVRQSKQYLNGQLTIGQPFWPCHSVSQRWRDGAFALGH